MKKTLSIAGIIGFTVAAAVTAVAGVTALPLFLAAGAVFCCGALASTDFVVQMTAQKAPVAPVEQQAATMGASVADAFHQAMKNNPKLKQAIHGQTFYKNVEKKPAITRWA